MHIPDIAERLDAGELTDDDVEGLLTDLYGNDETDEKMAHRGRLRNADGNINKLQLVALNRRVMVKHNNEVVEAQQAKPNVPDVGDVPDEIAEDAPKVWAIDADELRSKIGIIEVVRRYGKSQGRIDDSREETKIRCPFEDHLDEDPSASANKVKDTWDCYKCNMGGHQIDFFSVRKHGFITEHRSPEFGKLVHEMAEELGFIAPNPVPPPGPAPKAQTPPREDVRISPESEPIVPPSREAKEKVTITEEEMLEGIKKDDDLDIASLSLDWRKLDLPEESFLHLWMEQAEKEFYWIPSEYFLFTGLQAIGLACGHELTSTSLKLSLTGSMMVNLIGPSGYGKSTVLGVLQTMFSNLQGPMFDKDLGTGVKVLSEPGSAEALIKYFATYIKDPGPPATEKQVGVRGWLPIEEFSDFVNKTIRKGGENLKQRIMKLHDWSKRKDGPEKVFSEVTVTRGLVELEDAFFSATFTVQQKALSGLVEDRDRENGFLSRILFIFGDQRCERDLMDRVPIDPCPPYYEAYQELWDRCQFKQKKEFTDEAFAYAQHHSAVYRLAGQFENQDSMFSRLRHNALRCAFLLAVNDNADEIDQSHMERALRHIAPYLIACINATRAATQRTEADTIADDIVKFVQRRYNEHGVWPSSKNLHDDRLWKQLGSAMRQNAYEQLVRERRLICVKMIDDKKKIKNSALICPEEPGWEAWHMQEQNSSVTEEQLYGKVSN